MCDTDSVITDAKLNDYPDLMEEFMWDGCGVAAPATVSSPPSKPSNTTPVMAMAITHPVPRNLRVEAIILTGGEKNGSNGYYYLGWEC